MGAAENVTGADRLDEGPEDDEKDDLLTLTGLLSLSPSPPNTTPGRGRDGSAELNNVVADPIVVWGKPVGTRIGHRFRPYLLSQLGFSQ